MKLYLTITTILILFCTAQTLQAKDIYNSIKQALTSKRQITRKIPTNHPSYPLKIITNNLIGHKSGIAKKTIKELEVLLQNNQFKGEIEGEKVIENDVNYKIWRETLYLLLGRAYYESSNMEKAIFYYQGIPDNSALKSISLLELAWSYLQINDIDKTAKIIETIEDDFIGKIGKTHRDEYTLLKAFFQTKTNKFNEAIANATKAKVEKDAMLRGIKLKILAQANIDKYNAESADYSFKNKRLFLENIIKLVEKVDNKNRGPKFSFLASETYWLLASAYRIHDPVKHKKRWTSLLNTANNWITPWVDRAISSKRAMLSEEAMFFSVAILWEREQYVEAIRRLQALPVLFPQGKYLEDSYQMQGDYLYEKGQYEQAIKYYRKLARHGATEKAAYGVYKAGWSFHKIGKKWSALRHFERLLLHTLKRIKESDKDNSKKPGLLKESKQDFLLVLAELMSANKAIKELTIFNLKQDELIEYYVQVAGNFKMMGKFNDSIILWKHLLDNNEKNINALGWLSKLCLTQFKARRHRQLAHSLEKYLPKLFKNLGSNKSAKESYQKELDKMLLTIHREGRKSDDKDIWFATDKLYTSYLKFFPNSTNGDIWYFGAQRKERLDRKWEAMRWYNRAGHLTNYINKDDSIVSILRIINSLNDNLSLAKKRDTTTYKKLAQFSKKYIDDFPKRKDRSLAEFIYVESRHYSQERNIAYDYIVNSLNRKINSDDVWNLFIEENRRLYKEKRWNEISSFSYNIFTKAEKLNKNQKKTLLNIYQESSFQYAYQLEKRNSPAEDVARWYQKVNIPIDSNFFNSKLATKSWHNLFVYLLKKHATKLYLENWEKFKDHKVDNIDRKEKKLLYNLYLTSAKFFENRNEPPKKAEMLVKAAKYTDDQIDQEALIWDSVVIFGSYYQVKRMNQEFNKIKNSPLVTKRDNMLTWARLNFYNANYRKSWEQLKIVAKKYKLSPYLASGIMDIFFKTLFIQEQHKLHNEISSYLSNAEKKWKNSNTLRPVWSFIREKEFYEQIKRIDNKLKSRNIAAQVNAESNLEQRIKLVKNILKSLSRTRKKVAKTIKMWQPQLALEAICLAPTISSNTQKQLTALKKSPLKTTQWNEFITKLDSKIAQIEKKRQKEEKVCTTTKDKFAYLQKTKIAKTACIGFNCLPTLITEKDKIMKLEEKWLKKWRKDKVKTSNYQKTIEYLKIGALARAEYLIANMKKSSSKALISSLIRYLNYDTWNASLLLKKTKKNREHKTLSSLYLANLAIQLGNKNIASKEINLIDTNKLNDWEQDLMSEIKDKIDD